MFKALVTGTVVLGLAAAPAFAGQQPTGGQHPTSGQQTKTTQGAGKTTAGAKSSDENFVTKAAMGGMAEVELGRLATQKAASDEVKRFGQRMVDDHGKANDELKTLAQNKQITIPTTLDPHHKAMQDRLSKLSGASFDRAYMQAMLVDHRKDVNEFRMESKSGKDADVKSFAAKTLPTLEDHLKMAQTTNSAVGTSGTKASAEKSKTPAAKK
jgi:putative membrane protein